MNRFRLGILGLFLLISGWTYAQSGTPILVSPAQPSQFLPNDDPSAALPFQVDEQTPSVLVVPAPLPRMAPELTLEAYFDRALQQNARLSSYTANSVILAQLPATQQFGECDLHRLYSAPHTLVFKSVRFVGDGFVKNNVILRVLQSEVDHIQKENPAATALSEDNYKFSYKGSAQLQNRLVHVFQVRPRSNRPGLFKGRIYLDAHTGSLVRAEGRLAKSPSLFIKRIDFVQDYKDFGAFTFPVHIHSEARTRLVGRAIVDIYHYDYQPTPSTQTAQLMPIQ